MLVGNMEGSLLTALSGALYADSKPDMLHQRRVKAAVPPSALSFLLQSNPARAIPRDSHDAAREHRQGLQRPGVAFVFQIALFLLERKAVCVRKRSWVVLLESGIPDESGGGDSELV
jgi:hypothetical protein